MSIDTAAALPHKQRTRRLVIVDIENIALGPLHSTREASEARASVQASIGVRAGDLVVIGSDVSGVLHAAQAWSGVRYVMGQGVNGADLALLDVLCNENVEDRFTEVVIASGDGIFADAAAALARVGIQVTAVGHRGHMARRLRLAASRVVFVQTRPHTHPASDHGSAA